MKIQALTFSPTGTSARVIEGIMSGVGEKTGRDVALLDLTLKESVEMTFDADDVVLISGPVYGGKLAPIAKQRLGGMKGAGTRCIVVAVYGNRAFENAVTDFASFVEERGFTVVGVGAFVGEHSYSTDETPIAAGRPDAADMEEARKFGRAIGEKITADTLAKIDAAGLKDIPAPAESLANFKAFVMDYQRQQAESPRVYLPVVDEELCNGCGSCVDVCPTGAIAADGIGLDAAKCIKCCACVKECPQGARTLYTPFAKVLSANFNARKAPVWIV